LQQLQAIVHKRSYYTEAIPISRLVPVSGFACPMCVCIVSAYLRTFRHVYVRCTAT